MDWPWVLDDKHETDNSKYLQGGGHFNKRVYEPRTHSSTKYMS